MQDVLARLQNPHGWLRQQHDHKMTTTCTSRGTHVHYDLTYILLTPVLMFLICSSLSYQPGHRQTINTHCAGPALPAAAARCATLWLEARASLCDAAAFATKHSRHSVHYVVMYTLGASMTRHSSTCTHCARPIIHSAATASGTLPVEGLDSLLNPNCLLGPQRNRCHLWNSCSAEGKRWAVSPASMWHSSP